MQRIAIFAGAFDPIHNGHLGVLRAVLSAWGADKIILLPSNVPPYRKPAMPLKELREMCRLATGGIENIILAEQKPPNSDRNIISAIERIQETYGKAKYTYIVGADKLAGLLHWSKIKQLFKLCSFLVYPRVGYQEKEIIRFASDRGLKAELLEMLPLAVSSAMIRTAFLKVTEVNGLLDRRVERMIVRNGFYQADYFKAIRSRISSQRFVHTMGVMELAVDLAFSHQAWLQGAFVASLFHDCAKELSLDQMQAILRNSKDIPNDMVFNSTALLHGKAAAVIAKEVYGISHPDILNAITYHTTGRSGMSPLELCVFVADKAEKGRKNYPGLEAIRKLMHEDLEKAALISMKGTQKFVEKVGFQVRREAKEAIKALETSQDQTRSKNITG